MHALERTGVLQRQVEFLPSDTALVERAASGHGLTRPELAVLLAYAKNELETELVNSGVPDDPYLGRELFRYFPQLLADTYPQSIETHRLRREVIAAQLANGVINRGGPTFVTRLHDCSGRPAHDIIAAYSVVRDGFDLPALYREIDALDNRIDGDVQLELYQILWRLIHSSTSWFLKNDSGSMTVAERIAALQGARKALEPELPSIMPAFVRDRVSEHSRRLQADGTPEKLAERLAFLGISQLVPDISRVAASVKADLPEAAKAFFAITEAFRIARIEEAANAITPADYYDGLALSRAKDMIDEARRGMTIAALKDYPKSDDPAAAWIESGGERVVRVRERLQALTEAGDLTVSRLTVASGLMSDLGT